MCHSLFIHSPTESHLCGFQVLTIVNKSSIYKHDAGFYADISFQLFCQNSLEHDFSSSFFFFFYWISQSRFSLNPQEDLKYILLKGTNQLILS